MSWYMSYASALINRYNTYTGECVCSSGCSTSPASASHLMCCTIVAEPALQPLPSRIYPPLPSQAFNTRTIPPSFLGSSRTSRAARAVAHTPPRISEYAGHFPDSAGVALILLRGRRGALRCTEARSRLYICHCRMCVNLQVNCKPGEHNSEPRRRLITNWAGTMFGFLRQQDPNHMVGVGDEASGAREPSRAPRGTGSATGKPALTALP
jgi:hypothetical protein